MIKQTPIACRRLLFPRRVTTSKEFAHVILFLFACTSTFHSASAREASPNDNMTGSEKQRLQILQIVRWLSVSKTATDGMRVLSRTDIAARLKPVDSALAECDLPRTPPSNRFDAQYARAWEAMNQGNKRLHELREIIEIEEAKRKPARSWGVVTNEWSDFRIEVEQLKPVLERLRERELVSEKFGSGNIDSFEAAAEGLDTQEINQLRERYFIWLKRQGDAATQGSLVSRIIAETSFDKVFERLGPDLVPLLDTAARSGSAISAHQLGIAYLYGTGVPRNETRGLDLIKQSAQSGIAPAQYVYGSALWDGKYGLSQNLKDGFDWIHKAAESNVSDAQLLLGTFYRDGKSVPVNGAMALLWLKRAAEGKNAKAYLPLAEIYYAGVIVKQSTQESMEWAAKGAALGIPGCQRMLGTLYSDKRSADRNTDEAVKWYSKAIEGGDKEAKALLEQLRIQIAEDAKQSKLTAAMDRSRRARELYESACESLTGKGEHANESEFALQTLLQASDLGCIEADLEIGRMYFGGIGVVKNMDTARRYFQRAADTGNSEGMRLLGLAFREDRDSPRHCEQAIHFLTASMNQGNTTALLDVASMYANLEVDGKGFADALELYRKAAHAGSVDAKERLTTHERDPLMWLTAAVRKQVDAEVSASLEREAIQKVQQSLSDHPWMNAKVRGEHQTKIEEATVRLAHFEAIASVLQGRIAASSAGVRDIAEAKRRLREDKSTPPQYLKYLKE